MAGIIVVFDFDRTMIDGDSDNWVVNELGATELFQSLLPTMSWNSLMDRMMRELHSQGKTTEEIADCLKRIQLDPHVIEAIKSAYAHGSARHKFFICGAPVVILKSSTFVLPKRGTSISGARHLSTNGHIMAAKS
ncbi:hypothetical protein COCNU_14G003210 [Cocos nucifera]|uniref:Uncharacterized protein n=1 Tax=Cocos nucifera TaxID=13894 RepID=A0A8K0IUS0_COCNU|nr:hypothetical protein COCNU_14G003210 [Cocos nucifera]